MASEAAKRPLIEHFSALKDPRQIWKVVYPLPEIMLLVLCATLAGAEDFVEARLWGVKNLDFLRRFLPFLNAEDSLTEQASLRDLGLDSMGTVELLAVLESGYRVRFRDEALTLENFATPGILWTTLSAMR